MPKSLLAFVDETRAWVKSDVGTSIDWVPRESSFSELAIETLVVGPERIDTAIESTTLRCMYELHTEHDFSALPQQIDIGSPASLLAILITDKQSGNPPGAHGAQGEAASQP
jgi:hypothetical protein